MSLRKSINRLIKPFGYEIAKKHMGRHVWDDVFEFISASETRVVIDVGANEGQSGLEFLKLFPEATIHSFEPNPPVYEPLRSLSGKHSRWEVHKAALGSEPGQADFNVTAFHQSSSLLKGNPEAKRILNKALDCVEVIQVPVVTLDDFSRKHSIDKIDLLKIDTQGYELHVLRGAKDLMAGQRIGAISLEVNFAPFYDGQADFTDLHSFMTSHNYRLVGLYDNAYSPEKHLIWCDLLYAPLT